MKAQHNVSKKDLLDFVIFNYRTLCPEDCEFVEDPDRFNSNDIIVVVDLDSGELKMIDYVGAKKVFGFSVRENTSLESCTPFVQLFDIGYFAQLMDELDIDDREEARKHAEKMLDGE